MQVLASQLHFLANTNAELAIPPLFWPVNCIKIGGHVALLSDPTVYSLYCADMSISLPTIPVRPGPTGHTPSLNMQEHHVSSTPLVWLESLCVNDP